MLSHIDIIEHDGGEDWIECWKQSARQQASLPGFGGASLQKVYRELNRDGYRYVAISHWRRHAAYEGSRIQRDCYAYLDDDSFETGGQRFNVINSGHNPYETSRPGSLIVTNPYRIGADEAPRHAEMWDASKRHMQGREGFVQAHLYQTLDQNGEYYFVSRAEWRSEALFMSQFQGKDFKQIIAPFEGIFSICLSEVVGQMPAPSLA